MPTELTLMPTSEAFQIAKAFAASSVFKGTQWDIFAKIQAGRELGIPPFAAMTGLYVQGERTTMSANLMATLVKKSGTYDYDIVTLTETECELEFFRVIGDGPRVSIGKSKFTKDDAKKAGLTTGPNKHNYEHYPRNMLFARAISNGFKWYTPDLGGGAQWYVPEEVGKVNEEGHPVEGGTIDAEFEVPDDTVKEIEQAILDSKANRAALLDFYKIESFKQLNPKSVKGLLSQLTVRKRVKDVEAATRGEVPGQGQEVGIRTDEKG